MDYTTVKTACIVGAGVAGLGSARVLKEIGIRCSVFERNDKLGGVWTDGYLDYGVQVPKELYEFPDYPLPADTPSFTPGPVFQEYLEEFARHFGIFDDIQFETEVLKVEQVGNGTGWTVTTQKFDQTTTRKFDLVIVAVGLYSNVPYLPALEGKADFQGELLHISDLKSADLLKGKKVAVVGFGKSATDAALAASKHADSCHMVVRRLHWPVPRKLAGVLPFKWGLLNRLTVTVIPPYKSPTALEKAVHSIGKPLVWLFWRVVEALLSVQCCLWSRFGTRASLVPSEPVEIGAFNEATMVPRPGFYEAVRNGEIDLQLGDIDRLSKDGLHLGDGRRLAVDTIIFGTGWRSDYNFLSDQLQQKMGFGDDGIYLYRQILHPAVPGLAFIGYASTVSNVLAYHMQALWLAGLITGKHKLPDDDSQLQEIENLKRWKRSWMPFSHARAARLIVHLQHYLDELCEDLKINPLRKKGIWAPLAEVFAPYQPSDYRDITTADLRPAD